MISVILKALLLGPIAFAAAKKDQYIDSLVQENSTLSVETEKTVQVAKTASLRTFNIFLGQENAGQISFYIDGNKTVYQLNNFTAANFQYGYYPLSSPRTLFGVVGGIGYSYTEQKINDSATALHLVPLDLALATRYAMSSRLEALVSLGGGNMVAIQRGNDWDNSSKAKGYGIWQTGVSYGPKVQSDMPWEILLMYGQRFGPTTESQNWNGSFVRLGVGVRLD